MLIDYNNLRPKGEQLIKHDPNFSFEKAMKINQKVADSVDRRLYVVIIHKLSKRAFGLDRGYQLVCHDVPEPEKLVEKAVDNWLPSMNYQKPKWARNVSHKEFKAYWLY